MWAKGFKRENNENNGFVKCKLAKTTTEQCARECTYEKSITSPVMEKSEESGMSMWRKEMDDILSIILPPIDPSPEKQILLDLTRSLENQSNRNDDDDSSTLLAASSRALTKEVARQRRFKEALSRQEELLHIRSAGCFRNGVCQLRITRDTLNEVERLAKEYIGNIQPHPKYTIKNGGSTAFLRPEAKLFDLVKAAVFNSPLAVLHVKTIYAAILKRYPYFNTMDQKSFINWKSGLRHVLSVQWAFRVQFHTPLGLLKGYYYTLLASPTPLPEPEEDRHPMTREDPMLPLVTPSSTSGSETPTSLCGSESPGTKGWSPLEGMFDSPTVIRMVNHSPLISQGSCTSGVRSQESGYESLGSQFHYI